MFFQWKQFKHEAKKELLAKIDKTLHQIDDVDYGECEKNSHKTMASKPFIYFENIARAISHLHDCNYFVAGDRRLLVKHAKNAWTVVNGLVNLRRNQCDTPENRAFILKNPEYAFLASQECIKKEREKMAELTQPGNDFDFT
jgi:hypothetical protein